MGNFFKDIERSIRKNIGWENLLLGIPQLIVGNPLGALTTTGVGAAGKQLGIDYLGAIPFLASGGLPALGGTLTGVGEFLGIGDLVETGLAGLGGLGSSLGLGSLGGTAATGATGATGGGLLGGLGGLGGLLPLATGLYGASAIKKPMTVSGTQTLSATQPKRTPEQEAARQRLIQMLNSRATATGLGGLIAGAY